MRERGGEVCGNVRQSLVQVCNCRAAPAHTDKNIGQTVGIDGHYHY